MNQIVIATHNQDKLYEVKMILQDLPYSFKSLDDFPNMPEIAETGSTLLENSLLKAKAAYEYTGLPALGDDTGLEVDYLGGAPGVLSARYAGNNAVYQDNLLKLLDNLEGVPLQQRTAQFRTVISYVTKTKEQWVEGIVKGIILDKPRGNGGFGYDPIFYIPELLKTFSELSIAKKNKISHRGLALEKFRILLGNFDLAKQL